MFLGTSVCREMHCAVVSSWYLHSIFMNSLRYLHMLNSISIFFMNLAGIECLYSIILRWSEFETCELGLSHQELLQCGLFCHLPPRQAQEKDVTSLWTSVGFAQNFIQRFTQTLLSIASEEVEIVHYYFKNGLWLKLLTKQKKVF